jgi:hypothetical protein
MGSSGNKKLPPCEIPMVGILQKVLLTPTQLSHKQHHHGGAVCPFYGMGSMDVDEPNLTHTTSLKGDGQERLGLYFYEMIKY